MRKQSLEYTNSGRIECVIHCASNLFKRVVRNAHVYAKGFTDMSIQCQCKWR